MGNGSHNIILGLYGQFDLIDEYLRLGRDLPVPKRPESYTIAVLSDQVTIITASDISGLRLAISKFSEKYITFRPLKFWTGVSGKDESKLDFWDMKGKAEYFNSPNILNRVYSFGKYEDSIFPKEKEESSLVFYTKVIDSIAQLGFNVVDISRILEHIKLRTGTMIEEEYLLLLEVVDHIKSVGMKIQSDMSLGWTIKTENDNDKGCWESFSDLWEDKWDYLLRNSVLGDSDFLKLRARAIIWDSPYSCLCEKCVAKQDGEILTEIFLSFENIVKEIDPSIKLVAEFSPQFFNKFLSGELNLSENWLISIEDDSFGTAVMPEGLENKKNIFGLYLHAGSQFNRVIFDPYLDNLRSSISNYTDLGFNNYIMINGQLFKNFLLHIMYGAELMLGKDIESEDFVVNFWCHRYFRGFEKEIISINKDIAAATLLTTISKGYNGVKERGYLYFIRKVLWAQIDLINGDRDALVGEKDYFENLLIDWDKCLKKADLLYNDLKGQSKDFFEDNYLYPIRLFYLTVHFSYYLNRYIQSTKKDIQFVEQANFVLEDIYTLLETGSVLEEWCEKALSLKNLIEDELPPRNAFNVLIKESKDR